MVGVFGSRETRRPQNPIYQPNTLTAKKFGSFRRWFNTTVLESIMTNQTQVTTEFCPHVAIINGAIKTTSLKIAEHFNKQHKNVLRSIQSLDCSPEFNRLNFELVESADAKGEKRPAYELTRDGFMFLAMGFTGKQAAQWKEAYILAFNRMEAELLSRSPLPKPAQIKALMDEGYVVSPIGDMVAQFAEFLTLNKCPDNADNLPAPSPLLTRAELEKFVSEMKAKEGELLPPTQSHSLTINLTPLENKKQRRWLVAQVRDEGLLVQALDDKIVVKKDELKRALRKACGETITIRRNIEMTVRVNEEFYQDAEKAFFETLFCE
jgi:Rha family phage regulatory protein